VAKKRKQHQHSGHFDKQRQRTTVRLLRPIEGRPQAHVGAEIGVKRVATDRFRVFGLDVHRVEVQIDGTVGLLTDAGTVIISADDYTKLLDLQLPGGHWPRRMGRLPDPARTVLITTAEAGKVLGVSAAKILAWLHDGTLQTASTYENAYRTTCFYLDKAVISSPATRAQLADKITAYQRRLAAGKQATQMRFNRRRPRHDEQKGGAREEDDER
jgi:hypothetical protein